VTLTGWAANAADLPRWILATAILIQSVALLAWSLRPIVHAIAARIHVRSLATQQQVLVAVHQAWPELSPNEFAGAISTINQSIAPSTGRCHGVSRRAVAQLPPLPTKTRRRERPAPRLAARWAPGPPGRPDRPAARERRPPPRRAPDADALATASPLDHPGGLAVAGVGNVAVPSQRRQAREALPTDSGGGLSPSGKLTDPAVTTSGTTLATTRTATSPACARRRGDCWCPGRPVAGTPGGRRVLGVWRPPR
jgi:hypothetical protein